MFVFLMFFAFVLHSVPFSFVIRLCLRLPFYQSGIVFCLSALLLVVCLLFFVFRLYSLSLVFRLCLRNFCYVRIFFFSSIFLFFIQPPSFPYPSSLITERKSAAASFCTTKQAPSSVKRSNTRCSIVLRCFSHYLSSLC
jgi:hypothetical protein